MKIADLLDLLRIPNLCTVFSDILAAALLTDALQPEGARWKMLPLVFAVGGSLYLAGMVLNDLADQEADARTRPERPLPSGRIRRSTAIALAVILLLVGIIVSTFLGTRGMLLTLALVGIIFLYDLGLAGKAILGPAAMALCRVLNWAIALAAMGATPGGSWAALAIVFIYVFGLTHLSLGEEEGSHRRNVLLAMLTSLAAMLGVLLLGRIHPAQRNLMDWLAWSLPFVIWIWRIGPPLVKAGSNPTAPRVGRAVGSMVSSILWMGAAIALAVKEPLWLIAFLLLASAQEFLRRRFPVT